MKKLLAILGILVALVIVALIVVTRSGFLKSVVLPRVGAALNATVDAQSIALSPLSSVEIRNLTVTPNGAETLVKVEVARVRYNLFAILGGRLEIAEIHVGTPAVTLVGKPDGTSNLDPILKQLSAGGSAPAPATPPAAGKAPSIDLQKLTVENASFTYRAVDKAGTRLAGDVTGLNLAVTGIKNGGKGQITVGSTFAFSQTPEAAGAVANRLQGTHQGAFSLELTPDLAPGSVAGKWQASLSQGAGAFQEFQGFAATLTADLSASELKQVALEFAKQGTALGAVTAKGPLDLAKKEANLQVDIRAIDKNVLNLVGAGMGLDFTTTRFDSTNQVTMGSGGNAFSVVGSLTGTRVAVKKGDLVMPAVDLKDSYDLAVDLSAQVATLKSFGLQGTQGGREILRGSLAQPMKIGWSANAGALPDAKVELTVADLRLQDWSALVGTPVQGSVQAKASFGVQGGGKDLGFAVASALSGFSGQFGSNAVKNLGMQASVDGSLAAFAEPAKRRLVVNSKISDLGGEAAVVKFQRYGVEAKADLGLPEGAVALNDVQIRLSEGTTDGGSVGLKGRWDLVAGGGELNLVAQGVNESALRPFLQAALGDKQLRSVRLSADLGTKIDPKGESTVKATAVITNLVVRDPAGAVPETPLFVGLNLDGSGTQQKISLRQAGLKLSPTARAKNEVTLSGDLDFAKADALVGGFKLVAEALDVTPYFDLFAGGGAPAKAEKPTPSTTPTPAPGGPQKEPDPVKLPVELLTFDAQVGKFFLREVAAENFLAGVKIQSTRIEVQPLQLALNGAPIKAGLKLNLGVPGYEYDLNLSAGGIPVKPMANSFVPMLKDRIEGSIQAGAEIKGAGVTGVNLKKSLQGNLQFAVTNANLKLAAAGQKPGILSMLTSLLATALNIRELKDKPIMEIQAGAKMGGGKIDLVDTRARSASLEITTAGGIPIADDLMQSPLAFPVNVALSRELAEKAKLVPANTPTNAAYVPIPPIVSMKGTLGAPAPDVDKVKAGLLAARGIAGLVGGQTGDAIGGVADLVGGVAKGGTNAVGNLIQGIGNLLGGKGATNAASPSTNDTKATATETNAPANAVGNLLKGLFPKK